MKTTVYGVLGGKGSCEHLQASIFGFVIPVCFADVLYG